MTTSTRHQEIEDAFRKLVAEAGLPQPDEAAHLTRALVFLWYETKAFVLVDLEELPEGADPLDGLDLDRLQLDVSGYFPPGFAETC